MRFYPVRLLLLLLCTAFVSHEAFSQIHSNHNPWQEIQEFSIPAVYTKKDRLVPDSYKTLSLDQKQLKKALAEAPLRFSKNGTPQAALLQLPRPDGTLETFEIYEVQTMHPDLAAKYPQIKTYAGNSLQRPSVLVRLDYTLAGFHAMILDPETSDIFIDPYAKGETDYYICYAKEDYRRTQSPDFHCRYDEVNDLENDHIDHLEGEKTIGDCTFRSYRLALACTGEYAQYHGGTVPMVLSAMNTTMNRVNGIYERDIAATMQLVPNNDQLIFLNGGSDPYSNNDGFAMLSQNVTTCNNVIGSANYDIGHVFSTGGGGIASLESVCSGNKAAGVTGQPNPVGDPFDVDYVCHEIGHQFGGRHTQNNNCNRDFTSYEPGSASTIMGYAGICSPNVQNNSDAYFHVNSIILMRNFATGGGNSCANSTNIANTAPTADAGPNHVIPAGTPFMLTGAATDPDPDQLTYCWEQYDPQPVSMPPSPNNTAGPAFRSLDPTPDPVRTLPNLNDLVNNNSPTWEVLANVNRNYNFKLTVRDNNPLGGCIDDDDMLVTVSANAGPFVVTTPNTPVNWQANTMETVSWNVAGTTGSPVSTPNVDIFLSTDGGFTYPTTLASDVPNDGSHDVMVPNVMTSSARVMVKGAGNIFFDISNQNFTITAPADDFTLGVTPPEQSVCIPENGVFMIEIGATGDFSENVDLSVTGVPAGATFGFSADPVAAPGSSMLTISNTGSANPGSYPLTIEATASTGTQSQMVMLNIEPATPATPVLLTPADEAVDQSTSPQFSWEVADFAKSYDIEIATDVDFVNIVDSQNGLEDPQYTPAQALEGNTTYFWRVRANSPCGSSPFSETFSFTTSDEICESVASENVPLEIPNNQVVTITSDLKFEQAGTITDINLTGLEITHTWVNDLIVEITSPDGTTVRVLNQPCGEEDNVSISFDDESSDAYGTFPCPPTDGNAYQPFEALSAFDGENPDGTWTLSVEDVVNEDGGLLLSWGLEICYEAGDGELAVMVNAEDVSCPDASDGSLLAIATGGTGNYTYDWSNGAMDAEVNDVGAGVYFVTVSDGNTSVTGTGIIDEPSTIMLDFDITDATSAGDDGAIDLVVSGGTPGYSFLWSNDATSQNLSGLATGTYSVTVTDDNGCEMTGSATVGTMEEGCVPAVASSISVDGTTVTIDWNAVPDADRYRIRWRPVGSPTWQQITILAPASTNTFTGLLPDTEYEFQFKTRCTSETTPWGPLDFFTTGDGPIGPVCGAWAPDMVTPGSSTVTITYDPQPGADRYGLRYRVADSGGDWIRVVSLTTTIELTGLASGTIYEYNTRTRCPGGWTAWSSDLYEFETILNLNRDGGQQNDQVGKTSTTTENNGIRPDFLVQPNPARQFVEVKLLQGQGEQVLLQDFSGRILQSYEWIDQELIRLEIADLPQGIYFLTLTGKDQLPVTKRFIKQ
jgi:subtilisin-like proprotein convertase family protein